MPIYADKKNGMPTGRWCVEVQVNGQRVRGRCDTMPEAIAKESQWLKALEAGFTPEGASNPKMREDSRGIPTTLGALIRKAKLAVAGEVFRA